MTKRVISQAAMIAFLIFSSIAGGRPALGASDTFENGGTIILSQPYLVIFKDYARYVSFVVVPDATMRRLESVYEMESKVRIRLQSLHSDMLLYRQQDGSFVGRSDNRREVLMVVSRSWFRKYGLRH